MVKKQEFKLLTTNQDHLVLYTPKNQIPTKPNKQHEFDNLLMCCDNNTKNILQMNTILHPHLRRQICPSGCMCVDLYRVMSPKKNKKKNLSNHINYV